MLKVGITGGIGSGKSIVCKLFRLYNIPLFDADNTAKYLMDNDINLIAALKKAFGNEVYKKGRVDRPFLSQIVFNNEDSLQILNNIVHPAVIAYANEWYQQQNAPYAIKEAALFFESGSYKEMDVMIGVNAPKALRLKRAMQRDYATEGAILARMDKQMDNDQKMTLCDYVIENNDLESLILQVDNLNRILTHKSI